VVLVLPFVPVTPTVNIFSAHGNGARVGRVTAADSLASASSPMRSKARSSSAVSAAPSRAVVTIHAV